MFDDISNKRLPSFSTYLKEAIKNDPLQNREVWTSLMGLGVIGAGGLGFWAVWQGYGLLPAVAATIVVILPFLGYGAHKVEEWLRRPRNETERRKIEVFAAVNQFHQLVEKRKLHKNLDPVAGQLLDAAAYYWLKIRDTLNNSFWTHSGLGGHWKALRDQSLIAADLAMDDLILLTANCIGKPQKQRSEDLKEAWDDFVELDLVDAVQKLRNATSGDWAKYAHQSPNLRAIFAPAREIAEKLKALSSEVETMSQRAEAAPESPHRTAIATSASTIDILLHEMRATQQAEAELRDPEQQQLNQGG